MSAALAAVAAGGDSVAQSPTVSTPAVKIPPLKLPAAPPAAPVAVPTLPPPRSAPALPPTPKLPSTPKLPPAPKLPSTPATPIEPPPPGEPSLPRVDVGGLIRDRARAVEEAGGDPVGESLRAGGSLDPRTTSRSGATITPPTDRPNAGANTLAQGGLVAASLPSRSDLAKLPPAKRRALIRRTFDTPLRERRLRQLRKRIRQYSGCMRALPQRGRRVLELRAGLLGGDPASRRAIGRRIGASPRAVARLEQSSLLRLVDAGERGQCVGGSAATAFGGLTGGDGRPVGTFSDGDDGGGANSPSPAGEVLADTREGGASPIVDLGDGEEAPAETLLFFVLTLLAVLGPLTAIAIASRRRAAHGAGLSRAAEERPLLFLDVHGVIVLDPLGTPRGRLRQSSMGLSYIPDRTGALVRALATRFDIVWATGWEHRANTRLVSPLGLSEELPVLTFGSKARFGSSKWKIKPVKAYAGKRPAAWLDDNFVASHARWAAHRSAPTLLVPVDSRVGLSPEHVERLLQWADRLAPPRVAKPAAERRLRAG